MLVKTKFNINDDVFTLMKGKVKPVKVSGISIHIDSSDKILVSYYFNNSYIDLASESEVFNSLNELTKHILSDIEENNPEC